MYLSKRATMLAGVSPEESVRRHCTQQVPNGVTLQPRVRVAERAAGVAQAPDDEGHHHGAEGYQRPPPGQRRLGRRWMTASSSTAISAGNGASKRA